MYKKINCDNFIKDTYFILKTTEDYNPQLAYELIRKELLDRL